MAKANKSDSKDGVLAEIKKDKVMKIGIEGAYPPFNYYDNQNQLVGFDVDIANEISKRMGIKPEYIAIPWDTIIGGLLTKKYDVIISSMAITEERKQKVEFTDAYYRTGAQLFVNKNNKDIRDPKTDMKNKKIGVAIGTIFEKKAVELGANVINYKSDLLTFQDLANGRVEGVLSDRAVGARMIKEKSYPFKPVGDLLMESIAGIAVNKQEDTLKNELNKHIKEMMDDGTYSKISEKWFGDDIR